MIPIKLQVSGFLSYRDAAELDFSKFDLACISGPNGAGKSSLLDAITFALFGQARSKGDSLINSHRDVSAAQVTFTFGYEGNTYRVQRTLPRDERGLLEFQIQNQDGKWKALTEHSLRETETRIKETLRLDYDTFVNASFFLQGKADQFTQQNPTDRKRILSSILGLELWENYRQRAADHRKAVEEMIEVFGERRAVITRELTKIHETMHHCRLDEAAAWLQADDNRRRGEFVLVVQGAAEASREGAAHAEGTLKILLEELPLKQAVALGVKLTGASRNALYQLALGIKGEA